ncbi:hypothetical protein O7628_32630 [Micromonospora sp. WMMD956]|uniref:hypothetical protein n=1 Tax=Micromonospora sp. WMMD956 TaxID=3016108 RepID=UPI0024165695|nr:hypothetical protein [Micromonospora sp. WMMD956]MDG4813936.1 hypothetical protein [Micromonospora sp. WMMD956]MDG4813953.1 hypothetical protein [Micromonospora sp. WMMD956]MDG4820253.1 hypothetical protein [Micromonospora sp. WMMD956]
MIVPVLIGLLAATASPALSAPVAVEFFRTLTASTVSGDPGAPAVAISVRQATACDLTTALGEPVPGARLTVDGKVVYDGEAPPPGAETEPDEDASVVLRADVEALLALAPSDAPTGEVTLSCRDRAGSWVDVVNEPWRHGGFDDLPLAMPEAVAEQGQPLTVYDIWGIYQAADPVVYQMKIDAQPATITTGENAGAMQVSLPGELRPGLHDVTVQMGEKVMTVPFIQKGNIVEAQPSSSPSLLKWIYAGTGLAAIVVLMIVVLLRQRRRGQ